MSIQMISRDSSEGGMTQVVLASKINSTAAIDFVAFRRRRLEVHSEVNLSVEIIYGGGPL